MYEYTRPSGGFYRQRPTGQRGLSLPSTPPALGQAMDELRDLLGAGEYYQWALTLDNITVYSNDAYLNAIRGKLAELHAASVAQEAQ